MSMYTIEHESGRFRVRLEVDPYADAPYDDGGSPIIRLSRRGRSNAEQVTEITSHVIDPRIIEAADEFFGHELVFERYLRIFHGATEVRWYSPDGGDYFYVSFDTADWREKMGLPVNEAELISYKGRHGIERLVNLDEWRAYCEGDVYGFVVEELATWHAEGREDRETWEVVDSCWGFYGDTDYFRETAADAMRHAAAEVAA